MANIQNRAYAAAHFALELDGKDDVGLFRSIEGGGVKADVMTYTPSPNLENGGYQKWRQLGKPKFDDIKLQVGMSMAQPFYSWLAEFMTGEGTRKTGAILAADFNYNERARRNFKGALIKELAFPKLDAADKNAVYMAVTLAVEDITFEKGKGGKLKVPEKTSAQKLWTACNFRLELEGFNEALKRVTKIDSFVIKQNIAEYSGGGFKASVKTPTAMEYPNLAFYIPEADAQPFMDYLSEQVGFGEKHMGKGKVRDPKKMVGTITTFDNQNRPLLMVHFNGADVMSVAPEKSDAGSEDVKQVKIELFTESMTFEYPSGELE
jgi:phage tail-like protein